MPNDQKRINGPEESVPYELFARLKPKNTNNTNIENKSRLDIRPNEKYSKMFLQTGILSQAKGSAYVEIGQTKVIVSVFDPREIPNKVDYGLKGEVACEFKFAPFSCQKRKLHQQNNEEKQYSCMMKKALESAVCLHELPNFQVDVYALVLQDDGAALSGAIIGAGVALAEAGVPMYDIITSVTLEIVQNEGLGDTTTTNEANRPLRPLDNDKNSHNGMLVISKLDTHQQICQFYQRGYISRDKVKSHIETLSKACDVIVPLVKKCLTKGVINNIKS